MAGLMHLPKDHIPLGPAESAPAAYSALQCAPNVCCDLGMTSANFFEYCDRPDARRRLQHRHDLIVPKCRQRVRPSSSAWRFLLRGQPRITLNPVAARTAEAGFGGRNRRVVRISIFHIKPHLVVVDVTARQ